MPSQISQWIEETHGHLGLTIVGIETRDVREGFVSFHVQVTQDTLSRMSQDCPRVRAAVGAMVRVMGSDRGLLTRVYYDVVP